MRSAKIERKTAETEISVEIDLDGTGRYSNATGVGFFDHMLDQLSRHSLIDMTIKAEGDLHIDDHHAFALPDGRAGDHPQMLTRGLAARADTLEKRAAHQDDGDDQGQGQGGLAQGRQADQGVALGAADRVRDALGGS